MLLQLSFPHNICLEKKELNAAKLVSFTTFDGDFCDGNSKEHFTFTPGSNSNRLLVSWPARYGRNLVGALVKVAQNLRDERKDPSFLDFVVSLALGFVISHLLIILHPTGIPLWVPLACPR